MQTIDLNCDMAEGFANDALLMPWITSANIACGYHAGSESIMKRTIELALLYHVSIGAHPGFADKTNFGRTEMQLSSAEVYNLVAEQIHLLQTIAVGMGTSVKHVKPHGALYNMAAKDPVLANTIARAVFDSNRGLILVGLSGSCSIMEAAAVGLRTASEVFADRTYQDNGSLTPRNQSHALIDSAEKCLQQVLQMIEQKTVTSISGRILPIKAETICLHGDGEQAVSFVKNIYQTVKQRHIFIQSLSL